MSDYVLVRKIPEYSELQEPWVETEEEFAKRERALYYVLLRANKETCESWLVDWHDGFRWKPEPQPDEDVEP